MIRNLSKSTLDAGTHKVKWDTKDNNGNIVSGGIYLYRLTVDEFVETKHMILIKQ